MNADNHKKDRIAKIIVRAGLCSRREAERWIEQGRVQVNGQQLDSPAFTVDPATDQILVNGRPLPQKENTRLFLYHKPAGLVTSHKDEKGRPTVFESLPKDLPRVLSIGRLDLNTEGLLLLTNDGELSRYLELPKTGWKRKYRVRVHGPVDEKRLDKLKNGINIEGIRYRSIDAQRDSTQGTNSWLNMTLQEGKNREIRRVMEALGLQVTRLIRTDYGPFSLGNLPKGRIKEIETSIMHHQIPKFFKKRTP